ncbi:MAG: efflux transporter outer membrane subunit [Propionivibrio sp.]
MKKITLFPCLLLLSACSLMPDYARPELPVPDAWPAASLTESPAGKTAWSEVAWPAFFTDATLQGLIRQALDNNRDLRVAALDIEVARAAYGVTEAALLPEIDAGLSGTDQRTPSNLSQSFPKEARTTHRYDANLAMTAFELDLFGRLRSLNRQALESYLATAEARNATRIALIAEVANAYLALLGDRQQLALSDKTLATRQRSLALIERRLELGMSSELDRAQAQTAVESARTSQERYIRRLAQDFNALRLLLGTSIAEADPGRGADPQGLVSLVQDLPVGLPSEVLLSRPDVMQAEHALKAANANIGAARAAFFPRVSLTALAGFASPELSSLFDSDSRTWSFLPSVTVPIFDAGRNQATLDASVANKEIAVARYEKAIQSAFREVADGLAARKTLVRQVEAQESLVAAAEKSYRLSDARYKQGMETYLAVLDAERSLYAAQQELIQVQVERLANLVSLYKALGGGAS